MVEMSPCLVDELAVDQFDATIGNAKILIVMCNHHDGLTLSLKIR